MISYLILVAIFDYGLYRSPCSVTVDLPLKDWRYRCLPFQVLFEGFGCPLGNLWVYQYFSDILRLVVVGAPVDWRVRFLILGGGIRMQVQMLMTLMRWQLLKNLMGGLLVECWWHVLLFLWKQVVFVLGRHVSLVGDWLMTGSYDGSLGLIWLIIGAIWDHAALDVLNWVNLILVEHMEGWVPVRWWKWIQGRRVIGNWFSLLNLCLFEWPWVGLLGWAHTTPNLNGFIGSWHWCYLIGEGSHLIVIDLVGFPLWEMVIRAVLHLGCVCQ